MKSVRKRAYGKQSRGTGSSEPYATVLQSNLAEVGITAKITTLEFGVAVDRMASQDYNICIVGDNGNYDFNNFRQQAHSGSVGIYNVSRAAHIMLLDRYLGRHELLAANEHRRAVELRQQAVVVTAALAETAALAVKRQAGHDSEVDVCRGDERAALLRL